MSERLSVREAVTRGAKVAAPLLAVVALASCTTPQESVQAQAEARVDELSKTIQSETVPVEILPGAIVASKEVTVRETPAKVNFNNRLMIEGNEDWSLQNEPVVLQRPIVIENDFQVSDEDPEYWVSGYSPADGKGSTMFGLNAKTAPFLEYYVLPNTPRASLCGDELVGTTQAVINKDRPFEVSASGLTIYADSDDPSKGERPVGLRITTHTSVEAKIAGLEAQGYQKVPLCVPEMHQPQG